MFGYYGVTDKCIKQLNWSLLLVKPVLFASLCVPSIQLHYRHIFGSLIVYLLHGSLFLFIYHCKLIASKIKNVSNKRKIVLGSPSVPQTKQTLKLDKMFTLNLLKSENRFTCPVTFLYDVSSRSGALCYNFGWSSNFFGLWVSVVNIHLYFLSCSYKSNCDNSSPKWGKCSPQQFFFAPKEYVKIRFKFNTTMALWQISKGFLGSCIA